MGTESCGVASLFPTGKINFKLIVMLFTVTVTVYNSYYFYASTVSVSHNISKISAQCTISLTNHSSNVIKWYLATKSEKFNVLQLLSKPVFDGSILCMNAFTGIRRSYLL